MNTMISLVLLVSFCVLSVQSASCPPATYDSTNSKDTSYYAPGAQGKVNFVTGANCRVKETTLNPNPITGTFTFVADPGNPSVENGDGLTLLTTTYSVTGLTSGDHKYHVHNYGDIFSPDGATVENHFVGQTNTRPPTGPQEVGLLNDGIPVQNTDGPSATGSFPDHAADLTGHNSILGRAIIIHGNGGVDLLAKAAQCVIGLSTEDNNINNYYPETNLVTRATASLEKVGNAKIDGEITFQVNEWGTVDVKVFGTGFENNQNYYMTVNNYGDITADNGANMGPVFQGTVRYPISGGRSLIGQIGATTATTWTFQSDGYGIIHDATTDWEVDINGLNNIVGRGLLIRKVSGNAIAAQAVVGISFDSTYQTIPSPTGLAFSNSVPMVTEAIATLTAAPGVPVTTFHDGYVHFKRLPVGDPLLPGVRVRYHIVVGTAHTNHTLTIRSRGDFGSLSSSDVSGNVVFSGAFSGREGAYNDVGMIGDGVFLVSDAYGVLSGEFVDRSLWLGDYNSIIGRFVSLSPAGTNGVTNNDQSIAVGVIGRNAVSTDRRDYPAPIVTAAECVMAGVGTITLTQPSPLSPVTVTTSITSANAWGVAPHGDIWGDTTAGYLFAGTGVRYLSSTCLHAYAGALGDFSAGVYANISLSGSDSIIGRTLFISTDSNYHRSSPGGGNPVLGTQIRASQCVVGIKTETVTSPTGSGVHYLPSVATAAVITPPTITGALNDASTAVVSLAVFMLSLLSVLIL